MLWEEGEARGGPLCWTAPSRQSPQGATGWKNRGDAAQGARGLGRPAGEARSFLSLEASEVSSEPTRTFWREETLQRHDGRRQGPARGPHAAERGGGAPRAGPERWADVDRHVRPPRRRPSRWSQEAPQTERPPPATYCVLPAVPAPLCCRVHTLTQLCFRRHNARRRHFEKHLLCAVGIGKPLGGATYNRGTDGNRPGASAREQGVEDGGVGGYGGVEASQAGSRQAPRARNARLGPTPRSDRGCSALPAGHAGIGAPTGTYDGGSSEEASCRAPALPFSPPAFEDICLAFALCDWGGGKGVPSQVPL